MKLKPYLFMIAAAVCATVANTHAADWESIKRDAAQIEVLNMEPTPLVVSTEKWGWLSVPDQLTKYGAVIYKPTSPNSTNGVADIKVTSDGYLMLACNYDYEGNSSGKWDEEVWTEKTFKTKGWHVLSKNELGGVLIKDGNHAETIFVKQVRKGDTLRIRCNKYAPPVPILLSGK